MKRHAVRTQQRQQANDVVPTKQSVAQAQVEELLEKLAEDARTNAEKVKKEGEMI